MCFIFTFLDLIKIFKYPKYSIKIKHKKSDAESSIKTFCMNIYKSRTCNIQNFLKIAKGEKDELAYPPPTSRVTLLFGAVCLAHRQK